MKTIVNVNQKIGQPNFGSFGASCSFEIDIDQSLLGTDPTQILAHCKLLGDLARAAVDRELELQRRHATPADPARADDGFDTDDGPESRRPAERPSRSRDNRPPDNRTEDQRRESREERARGYNDYIEETRPRDDRPVQYQDGGRQPAQRGGGQQDNRWKGGLPKTGSSLYKWYCNQGGDVQGRVDNWKRDNDMPDQFRDWSDEAVGDCLHAIGASQGGGRRNGYAGSRNGNGRGSY